MLNPSPTPFVGKVLFAAGIALAAGRVYEHLSPVEIGLGTALLTFFAACTWSNAPASFPAFLAGAGLILLLSVLQESHRMAFRDELTGLPGRRMLEEQLLGLGPQFTVAMVDVDHFKKFNDTHGHQTGDHVLKFVGAMLKNAVKASDLPARYGGEEFALILPNTDLSSAVALAESIRVAVASKRLRKKQTGDDIGNITMSLGVSQYRPGESLSALIKRADDGLYQAKGLGRNQVVAETELSAVAD